MLRIFQNFLFKIILTIVISIFIGFQLAKIEFKETQYSFRKILGTDAQSENIIDEDIQERIKLFLNGKDGDYGIYVKDLKPESNRNVCINCQQGYEAASLYKLFLMAATYQAVSDGKFSLESRISAKMSHLEEIYGGVDSGYENFPDTEVIEYTVREALERIAGVSDNFAALMLAEKVGWDSVQDIADGIGTTQTNIKSPITTSAQDVGILLEKLYKGEIVSLNSSEEIIDMLTKSKLNNRIPAKLPEDLKIAHKTGELSRVRNDAGIVFLGTDPYVIVLMSKNLKGEDEGVETLAEISKIVYDYYSSNSEGR